MIFRTGHARPATSGKGASTPISSIQTPATTLPRPWLQARRRPPHPHRWQRLHFGLGCTPVGLRASDGQLVGEHWIIVRRGPQTPECLPTRAGIKGQQFILSLVEAVAGT
jgi:hypothetical protein